MTDKYYIKYQEILGSQRGSIIDRDSGEEILATKNNIYFDSQVLVDRLNDTYKKGIELSKDAKLCDAIELGLKNKHLEEENKCLKERFNDFENSFSYAYTALNILEKMGHRYFQVHYGINKTPDNNIVFEKEEGLFGKSYKVKKNGMTFGIIKDVDDEIVKEYIEPLSNAFYEQGKLDKDFEESRSDR